MENQSLQVETTFLSKILFREGDAHIPFVLDSERDAHTPFGAIS